MSNAPLVLQGVDVNVNRTVSDVMNSCTEDVGLHSAVRVDVGLNERAVLGDGFFCHHF